MAGYSGTPLPRKLGIKETHLVALFNAPADFRTTLGALPAGVQLFRDPADGDDFDVIVFFSKSANEIATGFPELIGRIVPAGGIWHRRHVVRPAIRHSERKPPQDEADALTGYSGRPNRYCVVPEASGSALWMRSAKATPACSVVGCSDTSSVSAAATSMSV